MAASFAWIGWNRLSDARASGEFHYLWHGVGQDNWPLLFSFLKAFLAVWTGVTCLMTLIACIWLTLALVQKLK